MKKFIIILSTFLLLFSTYAYATPRSFYEEPCTLSIWRDPSYIDYNLNVSESFSMHETEIPDKIVRKINKVNNSPISIKKITGFISNNKKSTNITFFPTPLASNNYTLKETENFYELTLSCENYSKLSALNIEYSIPLAFTMYNDSLSLESTIYDNTQNSLKVTMIKLDDSYLDRDSINDVKGFWAKNITPSEVNCDSSNIDSYFTLDSDSKLEGITCYSLTHKSSEISAIYPIKKNENRISTIDSSYGKNLFVKNSSQDTQRSYNHTSSYASTVLQYIAIIATIIVLLKVILNKKRKANNRNRTSINKTILNNNNNTNINHNIPNNNNNNNTANTNTNTNTNTTNNSTSYTDSTITDCDFKISNNINTNSINTNVFPSSISPSFLSILMQCDAKTIALITFLDLVRNGVISIEPNTEFNRVLNGSTISEYILKVNNCTSQLTPYEIEFTNKISNLESLGTIYLCDLNNLNYYNCFDNIKEICTNNYRESISNNIKDESLYFDTWKDFSSRLSQYTQNDLSSFSVDNLEKLNLYSFALNVKNTSTDIQNILNSEVKNSSKYFKSVLSNLDDYHKNSDYTSVLDYIVYTFFNTY